MAPSLRGTAPSTSASNTTSRSRTIATATITGQKTLVQTAQTQQLKSALNSSAVVQNGFGRVTKSRAGRLGLRVKFSEVERGAFEREVDGLEDVEIVQLPTQTQTPRVVDEIEHCEEAKSTVKRKRGDVNGCESEDESSVHGGEQIKKRRIQSLKQLLTPPASRDGTDGDESPASKSPSKVSFPDRLSGAASAVIAGPAAVLLDMISMHAAFLKALSLHYAHNGAGSPAELGALLESMTRVWRKQNVRQDNLRKMLGLYEVSADPGLLASKKVDRKASPFTVITSGLGTLVRTNLEYVGESQFNEATLQKAYSDLIDRFSRDRPTIESGTELPLLAVTLGTQTSLYRAKAASTRADILSLSASAQARSATDFSKLSITDTSEQTPAAVKSRTLSLFDRVRAKGLAAAKNAVTTPEQIARQHAMGRVSEVVEFLRMKQQQKLSTQFQSSVHNSPGKMKNAGKASFSLGAIVRDIRQSVGIPIGEEEVKVCLRIISYELPGDWCRIIELGSVVSITLQGSGMTGMQVKSYLEQTASTT